ncbi:MAG: sugar phosphate nucleotidyltransferase [Candidatus Aenigmatarchaeota archaeon]
MKAVILAAGEGTRLRPLTNDKPKPLVNINGKPFIHYLLRNIKKAGIKNIGIVAGYRKEMIEDFLSGAKIHASIIEQPKRLGTGHAVKLTEDFIDGEDFIVLMGDNLYSTEDIKAISREDGCVVAGISHPKPEKFGVIVENNGIIKDIIEKSKAPTSNIINAGLYKFTIDIFPALKKIKKSERGEFELTSAVTALAKAGTVKLYTMKDYWLDVGCLDDIKKVEEFLKGK